MNQIFAPSLSTLLMIIQAFFGIIDCRMFVICVFNLFCAYFCGLQKSEYCHKKIRSLSPG